MPTVLLRLAAPMQSWGVDSVYNTRSSGVVPSKSAVIGLVASAMGRSRCDAMEDLSDLRFGVRADQPGRMMRDYQTVRNPKKDEVMFTIDRYYLSDAIFLAGLEGDASIVGEIDAALRFPMFPPFLGRRSCPPTQPLSLGVRELGLTEALSQEGWLASVWYRRKSPPKVSLEAVMDSDAEGADSMVRDVPESFDPRRREYGYRQVRHVLDFVSFDNPDSRRRPIVTDHDPISAIRGSSRCISHVWRSIRADAAHCR